MSQHIAFGIVYTYLHIYIYNQEENREPESHDKTADIFYTWQIFMS